VITGLLAALLSAVAYGVASVLQALSARAEADTGRVDARLLVRLVRRGPFVAGMALDLVGFLGQVVALRTLVVYLVQAVQAGNLAVTAVVAVPVLGARLRGREWAAVAAVCAGLALLAVASGSERVSPVSTAFRWYLLLAAAVFIACGFVVGRASGRWVPSALGFVAGLGFGVMALAARVLTDLHVGHLVRDPATYALIAGGGVSFLFFATALQRGAVTTVTAAVIVAETFLPAVVGIEALGDRARPGYAPLAVAGFLVAVAGALVLARFGELAPQHPPAEYLDA
jgi:drug/metabolite transporter (DMT)-like permease